MPIATPRLLALGDSAWTVEFGESISTELNAMVMALANHIELAKEHEPLFKEVVVLVPTFRSLTVHFSPLNTDAQALGKRLLAMAQLVTPQELLGRQWRLPACFDKEFALDLSDLAASKQMSEAKVIEEILCSTFRVFMIGFLPGFPYMGGLPKALATPRLKTPRQRVASNSIAVTGEMCAVYPWNSPGGWNLIGSTPVCLFDLRHPVQPAMLAAGDTVIWYEISRSDYADLFAQCQTGHMTREAFLLNG
jgi:KipI family sensor histidine kinase inhibitor